MQDFELMASVKGRNMFKKIKHRHESYYFNLFLASSAVFIIWFKDCSTVTVLLINSFSRIEMISEFIDRFVINKRFSMASNISIGSLIDS
jgi:hypothetical protein